MKLCLALSLFASVASALQGGLVGFHAKLGDSQSCLTAITNDMTWCKSNEACWKTFQGCTTDAQTQGTTDPSYDTENCRQFKTICADNTTMDGEFCTQNMEIEAYGIKEKEYGFVCKPVACSTTDIENYLRNNVQGVTIDNVSVQCGPSSGLSTGVIVGIAVGSIVAVMGLGIVFRAQRKRRAAQADDSVYTDLH